MKFAPEGFPFILGSLVFTALASVFTLLTYKSGGTAFHISSGAVCFFSIVALFMGYFFRDPDRTIPEGKGLFVAPADGKIILIKDVNEKKYIKSDAKEISIFMSPFNVHVNRAPCDGKVSTVKHSPGRYMAAYKDDASMKNENIAMLLEGKEGKVLVRQVAGFIARRAVCRVKPGDMLKRGERYGMIKFSSRLDVYLPKNTEITVKLGDVVKAGETAIARIKD
jgi:phosphatidylserine decarboxylase